MTLPYSTGRLLLRSLRTADLAEFLAYRNDPEVARFQSWNDISPTAALDFLLAQGRPSFSTRGTWQQVAIALAGDDRLIGDLGFCIRGDGRSVELGVTIAAQHQGLGLAREALTGLIQVVGALVALDRLDVVVDARNVRALRLFERLGFRVNSSAEVLFKGAACIEHTLTLPRATWAA